MSNTHANDLEMTLLSSSDAEKNCSNATERKKIIHNLQEKFSQITDSLRAIKLFPVFNDRNLGEISIAYHFYFEINKTVIDIAFSLIIASLIPVAVTFLPLIFISSSNYSLTNQETFWLLLSIMILNIFFIRHYRVKHERKMLESPAIYDTWGEEKFSLLFSNISKTAKREEIREYFNELCHEVGSKTGIMKMILLQDINLYYKYKYKVQSIDRRIRNNDKESELLKLQKIGLLELMKIEEEKAQKFENFNGKAIVIFDKVGTKSKVSSLFISDTTMKSPRPKFFKGYQIEAEHLAEPGEIYYENLHFSASERFKKSLIAVSLGILVISVGMTISLILTLGRLCNESDKSFDICSKFEDKILFDGLSSKFLIFLNGLLIEATYIFFDNIKIHRNSTEKIESYLKYANFMCYFNYIGLVVPAIILSLEHQSTLDQILITFFSIFVTKLIGKYVRSKPWRKIKREKFMKDPTNPTFKFEDILSSFREEPFNFALGIRDNVAIIFMVLAFNQLSVIFVLPTGIFCIYGLSLMDKYIMKNYTIPYKLNDVNYGLTFLKILEWDLTVNMTYTTVWMFSQVYNNLSGLSSFELDIASIIFVGFAIFWMISFIPNQKNMIAQTRKIFDQIHSEVRYHEVSNRFLNKFDKAYPWFKYQ